MQTSDTKRVADFHQAAKQPDGVPVPEHLENLPADTHIVSGVIEGHGSTEFASSKAKLSAKVVMLERTASGGVSYQLAIFVSEPTQAEAGPVLVPPTPDELAAQYFIEKGMKPETAKAQVARFGAHRVLAMKEKELDQELANVIKE